MSSFLFKICFARVHVLYSIRRQPHARSTSPADDLWSVQPSRPDETVSWFWLRC